MSKASDIVTKAYIRGRPIESLTREELEFELIQSAERYYRLIQEHERQLAVLGIIRTPPPQRPFVLDVLDWFRGKIFSIGRKHA